jgi:hypothetical protein
MAPGRQVLANNWYESLNRRLQRRKPSRRLTVNTSSEANLISASPVVFLPGRVDNVYGDRNLICTLQQASQVTEEAAAAATA